MVPLRAATPLGERLDVTVNTTTADHTIGRVLHKDMKKDTLHWLDNEVTHDTLVWLRLESERYPHDKMPSALRIDFSTV